MNINNDITQKLLQKSIEAFMLSLEIYNKPTIKYRVEGFSFFICNAWELMLKAHMINENGSDSIYYKDNPDRTKTLELCVKTVFTNDKDPLRKNLEKIIELRNMSTHFIVEEYEMIYVPLFQSCIFNYSEKMQAFHNIDITTFVPQNFLTLSISMSSLNETEIIAKYPEEIATKILTKKNDIDDIAINSNEKFSIRIEHYHYLTKNENRATSFVKVNNSANTEVKIIRDVKDPNNTHNYTAKSCILIINEQIKKAGITIYYNEHETKFNNFHFTNFCKYYGLKENERYCYVHKQYTSPQYSYSQQMIDFIVAEIKKDPKNILTNIKK